MEYLPLQYDLKKLEKDLRTYKIKKQSGYGRSTLDKKFLFTLIDELIEERGYLWDHV